MAEASKIRLVRCPKCENLLHELDDYSVYQCGGCGTVLRGNKREPESGALLENEGGEGDLAKWAVGLGSTSVKEGENDGLDLNTKERASQERVVNLNANSSSRAENGEVLIGREGIRRNEAIGSSSDRKQEAVGSDDKNRRPLRVPIRGGYEGNYRDLNMNNCEFVGLGLRNEDDESRLPFGSMKSRPVMEEWSVDRNGGPMAFRGNARGVAEVGRFSTFPYTDEGPSNYPDGSFQEYGKHIRNPGVLDGFTKVENLENDRAVLLRKLNELKDQLTKERVPPPQADVHGRNEASAQEGSMSMYSVNKQAPARDKHVPKPSHVSHHHEHVPYVTNHALDAQDFYHPRNTPNQFLGYENAYRPQMLQMPPHQPPHQYLPRTYGDHFPGQYMDFNRDPLALHPHETFFHQPACSCLSCYNQNWQIPPRVHPPVYSNQRSPNDCVYPIFHQHRNPATYGPPGYDARVSKPHQLHFRDQQPQIRSSSGLDSENGGFGYRRPRRVVVARGSERVCFPIAGGAPFITCCNCFELLKLPRKVMMTGKSLKKMRCGACSAFLLLEIVDKCLVVSVSTQIEQVSAELDDVKNLQQSHGFNNAGVTNSSSDDFDISSFNFQLTDDVSNLLSRERLDIGEAEKRQATHITSSSFSEDEQSPDSASIRGDDSNSAELPLEDNSPLPFPDSPLQEHLDFSFKTAVSRYGKGNKSTRIDQEKVIVGQITSGQNSVKDAPVATEMEVSINDYLHSDVSHDSAEVSKEESQHRMTRGSEPFFAGLMKKSFRDLSRSSQSMENGRSNTFVNGQLIPDRVIKKAEKLAGPIQPGEYWYDYRAGFWGVMGQPCLGIILPFIEEFNFPMPEKCGAGNTGVFVNGRELHQRDLDLLVGRGLPMTRDKSYIIDISGRVLDEDTGEELDGLGKLAPTVEKAKHGFGMKAPRAVA
ncbi:hypothetical protein RJ639_020542 [Escallonia herrerae]|uniref:Zinc-ribbon domain-containing protein n=1 Tax=Escallonia herrerae TaxID=1293975 RepID=A0AA89AH35_9ASTE|nr:hypothetical protein RJ639_020542 [Escallonia herrerae]